MFKNTNTSKNTTAPQSKETTYKMQNTKISSMPKINTENNTHKIIYKTQNAKQ